MKQSYLLFIIFVSFTLACKSKTKTNLFESCDFFNHVSFKNGTDTLIIKGQYGSMGKLIKDGALTSLGKEGKLNIKDFTYAIVFQPENCTDEFYIPSRDHGADAVSLFKIQHSTTVYLTCIFFENYKYEGSKNGDKPFFVVDKISFKE